MMKRLNICDIRFVAALFCLSFLNASFTVGLIERQASPTSSPPAHLPSLPAEAIENSESTIDVPRPKLVTPSTAPASAHSTSIASPSVDAPTATSSPSSLHETGDPSECHITQPAKNEPIENIFCKPSPGQSVLANTEFEAQWDTSYFSPNTTISIHFYLSSRADKNNLTAAALQLLPEDALFFASNSTNVDSGTKSLNLSSNLIGNYHNLQPPFNLTLVLVPHPSSPGNASMSDTNNATIFTTAQSGPTIDFATKNTTNASDKPLASNATDLPTNSSTPIHTTPKKVGEKVGIPIGTIIFIVLLVIVIYILYQRHRAGFRIPFFSRLLNTLLGKSHQKWNNNSSQTTRGDLVGPYQSRQGGDSFRDEPTRGGRGSGSLELQDRQSRREAGDADWDWDSPLASPTEGQTNVFREEISRQKGPR